MWKAIKRQWKYLGVKMRLVQEQRADPKVQLEQAIEEAREQHRRLKEQAANVIANQKQAEIRLSSAVEDKEPTGEEIRRPVEAATWRAADLQVRGTSGSGGGGCGACRASWCGAGGGRRRPSRFGCVRRR